MWLAVYLLLALSNLLPRANSGEICQTTNCFERHVFPYKANPKSSIKTQTETRINRYEIKKEKIQQRTDQLN